MIQQELEGLVLKVLEPKENKRRVLRKSEGHLEKQDTGEKQGYRAILFCPDEVKM